MEEKKEAEVTNLDEVRKAVKSESFSTTALKMIRRHSKDQLVSHVVNLNNYAEQQKAANMILFYQVKNLNEELQKLRAELLTYRPEPEAAATSAEQSGEKK